MMILFGVFLILLLGSAESQAPKVAGCSGYMFLGEESTSTCDQYVAFLKTAKSTVEYLTDDNDFAIRAFGKPIGWLSLEYSNQSSFILKVEDWIMLYNNGACNYSEIVQYENPLEDVLNHLRKDFSGHTGYGIFLTGETDTIVDLPVAMDLAQQIAAYNNTHIYVWDISINNNSNTLFETLTGGKPGHIIRGANLTYKDVMTYLASTMVPEFMSISCNPMPVTPTPPPDCSVLVFMEEDSVYIDANTKLNFLKLIQRLLNAIDFNPNQRFALSFFGEIVYRHIEPLPLSEFNATLSDVIQSMSSGNFTNASRTYLSDILTEYLEFVRYGFYENFFALFMSEIEGIKDPTYAFNDCQTVASLGTDFYVIDQSQDTGPSSLFPTCTGNKPGHVLNGTALSQDQLFNQLKNSLIQTFSSMTC